MAIDADYWEICRTLYCIEGKSLREISNFMTERGIKISNPAICKRAKKEKWIKYEGAFEGRKIKKITERFYEPAETNEQFLYRKAHEIREEKGDPSKKYLNHALEIFRDTVIKSLQLKREIVESTMDRFEKGDVDEMKASRIMANLGLNALNLARLIGISVEDNIAKEKEEKDVTGSAINFYMPNNGRE